MRRDRGLGIDEIGHEEFYKLLNDGVNYKVVETEWESHDGTVSRPISILKMDDRAECRKYMNEIHRKDPFLTFDLIGPSGRISSYAIDACPSRCFHDNMNL